MIKQIPRQIVFELLSDHGGAASFIEDSLTRSLNQLHIDGRDRRFIQNLTYGVIRHSGVLDWIIDQSVTRKPPGGAVRVLLRMGVYQILFMDRVAEHAAIHETVECAKRAGLDRQAGFINGLLRNILRAQSQLEADLQSLQETEPWIRFSHPEWLYQKFLEQYGPEPVRQWMAWNNEPADIFLSHNGLMNDPFALVRILEQEECYVQVIPVPLLNDHKCLKWISGLPPQLTKAFAEGRFYIQDPSTHIAALWVRAQPGQRVLDMCAAPGGKTQLLVQNLSPDVHIDAADADPARILKLTQNLERLQMTGRVQILGETPAPEKKYDWILLDAPCSNSGVLRRRVELRWRIREDECLELAKVQLNLLRQARALLKDDGKIIYSTCSLDSDENEKILRAIQSEFPELMLLQQKKITPWQDHYDGAFIACLAPRL